MIALAQAFQHKKPIHAEALWNAVPGMQFTGLTGLKHFDTEGELISAVYNIYKVRNNAWTVVGQDRVDQPPAGAEHIPAGAAKILLPQALAQGFKQWLPGNDPCIGHFAGAVGENDTWVAESTDLDIGYNLIAYSDDTCRDRNNYGIEYIFGPGQPYNLSFDIAREELADAPTEGAILEVELTAVVRTVDEEGCENYISAILPSRKITFADWPQPALTRITIPFTYSAPPLPATASVRPEDYFLKWELRLQNTARQKITLHKIWLWAEPLENPLPPFDSTVEAWTVY
ncbi:MAG: hypothetical protein RBU29_12555 [bacterium]|nr:hypothetical protein [bacterium]